MVKIINFISKISFLDMVTEKVPICLHFVTDTNLMRCSKFSTQKEITSQTD